MADSVFIDMPIDGEEVVHTFQFQERTTLSLQFGYDKLGLQFGQLQDSTPQPTRPQQQTPTIIDYLEAEINHQMNTDAITLQQPLQQHLQQNTTLPPANTSPSNSPIIRHKIEVSRTLTSRKSRPFLAAQRRTYNRRFSTGEDYEDREMDRLTFEFNSKVKVNRKKKIEMKTLKSNIAMVDLQL